ncbi:MAG: M23 family metallopeptidase [Chloroflexi bacterium]|nr:M23 family metallopeptidase [Chloroflexota bacterium]
MFDFLNPFKFIAFVGVILLANIACFVVVYVALIGFTVMNLPFGREVAQRWMLGELPGRVITLGDDLPWPFAPNPYYRVFSAGPALVPWLTPLQGDLRITAGFLDPVYQQEFGRPHYGVDLSCPAGTPVYATHGGRVYHSGDVGTGLGLYVGLGNDHFTSEYGHLSVALVHHGDVVQPGALIGYSGNTGTTTGAHLHYSVMYDYDWVDPAQFWQGPVSEVVLFDGQRVPLPSEALAAPGGLTAVDPFTVPAGGDSVYLLGGAMGQYFPSNPPPVPGDWAHRGIPYITGARDKEWAVVYARRLSDAENHGNLRLYGHVLGPHGLGLGGVEVRCFSDAGWESVTRTNADGSYEFAGFSREAVLSLEVVGESQRVYNLWFVHPSAGGHCSYEVVWRKQKQ